ncbi:MAG: MEDS domain-containing protein [Chloroflexota bacterium]
MIRSKHYIKTGIAAVPLVKPGTHICHFFKDKQELSDVIVSYIGAGLLGNEKCIWVTSDTISREEALAELNKKVNGASDYIAKGQLLIVNYDAWYTNQGKCHFDNVLNSWIEAERLALDEGYTGLRAAGIMSWVKREDWDRLVDYEAAVDSVLGKHKIVALCCYSLSSLETGEVIDMVSNHAMVLINRKGGLMAVGNSRRAKICIMKGGDNSYTAIGSKLGISRQRAHQILNGKKKSRRMLSNMLTTSEAAFKLSIHVNTLRRWSNLGVLPVYRLGSRGDRRFKQEDIDNLIQA